MSVIENSIGGTAEYDTKLDKLNKEQRELVKLYYLTDEPQAKAILQQKMNDISSLAEIMIGKQRHGPTGNVRVEFEAMYTKFKDLENK